MIVSMLLCRFSSVLTVFSILCICKRLPIWFLRCSELLQSVICLLACCYVFFDVQNGFQCYALVRMLLYGFHCVQTGFQSVTHLLACCYFIAFIVVLRVLGACQHVAAQALRCSELFQSAAMQLLRCFQRFYFAVMQLILTCQETVASQSVHQPRGPYSVA